MTTTRLPNNQMVTLAMLFADIARNTKIYGPFADTVARDAISAYLKIVTGVAGRLQGRLVKAIDAEAMIWVNTRVIHSDMVPFN